MGVVQLCLTHMHQAAQSQVEFLLSDGAVDYLPPSIALHQSRQTRLEEVVVIEGLEAVADEGSSKSALRAKFVRVRPDHYTFVLFLPDPIHQRIELLAVILNQAPGVIDVQFGPAADLLKRNVVNVQHFGRHTAVSLQNDLRLVWAILDNLGLELKLPRRSYVVLLAGLIRTHL